MNVDWSEARFWLALAQWILPGLVAMALFIQQRSTARASQISELRLSTRELIEQVRGEQAAAIRDVNTETRRWIEALEAKKTEEHDLFRRQLDHHAARIIYFDQLAADHAKREDRMLHLLESLASRSMGAR